MRTLRILTPAYGERYVRLASDACLRSLFQPNNLPAILASGRRVEHHVYCPKEDAASLRFPPTDGYTMRCAWMDNVEPSKIFLCALVHLIKTCLQDDALLMIALPDWFFADGSVKYLVDYVADRNMVVAGLNVRVLDKGFLSDPRVADGHPIGPAELVDLTFDHPHFCTRFADVTRPVNHARWGGMFLQPMGPGLWSIMCRVPHPFLASLVPADYDAFLNTEHGHAYWDWVWPSKLVKENRLRILGSSDQFFMVDLTQENVNRPKLMYSDLYHDDFENDGRHNPGQEKLGHVLASRPFVGSLRGTAFR